VIMGSLKRLCARELGGHFKSINYGIHENRNGPLFTRLPNLEVLDIAGNCLNMGFLIKLSELCPKLKSLDRSQCVLGQVSDFNLFFSAVKMLNTLKMENLQWKDGVFEVSEIEHSDLQVCIESISLNLKNLQVLDMCKYSVMTNEQVVHLIANLPQLQELKIQECPKVNEDLLPLLRDHPDITKRNQTLVIRAAQSGFTDVRGEVDVTQGIELDLMFSGICPYNDDYDHYVGDYNGKLSSPPLK